MKQYIISVDLGGTKILSALIDLEKNGIVHRVKIPTDTSNGPNSIVEAIYNSILSIIEKMEVEVEDIAAICLGVPGTVYPDTGVIGNAPNLDIRNYNIKEVLGNLIPIPILVENDVNLAGLGIKHFELNDQSNNMLVIFVGTGIGSALFFDGKLYRGSSYFAGEIGHMLVDSKGSLEGKGKKITFENLASRTGIVNSIKQKIGKNRRSALSEYLESDIEIKSKVLASALKDDDELTKKQLKRAGKIIGRVAGSINTLLNLDTIVFGGGVIEAMHEFMMPVIEKAFNKTVLPEPGKFVKLMVTKLGDDAPLLGGIILTREFLKE